MEKDINTVDEKIEEEVEQKEAETVEASQSAEATTDVEDTPVEEKEVVSEEKTEEVKEDAPVEEKEKFDSSIQVSNETNEIVEDDTKKKNKEPRSTKEKVFLGLKIAGNILFYLVIILLFLVSIMNINANNNDGMPSIFGRGYLSVQSNSMSNPGGLPNPYLQTSNTKARKGVDYYKFEEITDLVAGDPTPENTYTHNYGQYFAYSGSALGSKVYYRRIKVDIKSGSKITEKLYTTYQDEYDSYEIGYFKKGDMVVDETLSAKEKKNLKVGDVITFYDTTLGNGQGQGLNSHRIVYINEEGDYYLMGDFSLRMYKDYGRYSMVEDGQESEYNWFTKQGKTDDQNLDIITHDQYSLIKGKVIDVWSGVGATYDKIMGNMALYFLVFVFPVILLFLISMIFVILNIRKLVIARKHPEGEKVMTEEEMKSSLEAERERMRQEILAELQKEQALKEAKESSEDKADEDK